jgi:hypothetical protein
MLSSTAPAEFTGLVAHVTYQLAGFDRINFVSDIAAVIPQDGSCTIRALNFEADGIKANGLLTIQMWEESRTKGLLIQRLQSVGGMVSVREI